VQGFFTGLGLAYDQQAFNVGKHARDACANQVVVIDY
jgi:hypothetical protein